MGKFELFFSITIGGTYNNHFFKRYVWNEAGQYNAGLCACLEENIRPESPNYKAR